MDEMFIFVFAGDEYVIQIGIAARKTTEDLVDEVQRACRRTQNSPKGVITAVFGISEGSTGM